MKKIFYSMLFVCLSVLGFSQPTGQFQKLFPSLDAGGDYFGFDVAIDGNYAVVGTYNDDVMGSNSGSVYVYQKKYGQWLQMAKLTASDGGVDDFFGYSVDISGDNIVVGAYGDDDNGTNAGAVYIFNYSSGLWNQVAKLTPATAYASDQFGYSVAIDGNYVVIGANYDDNQGQNSGTAFVFYNNTGSWTEQTILTASDGAALQYFGNEVDIYGNYAIVGNYLKDITGTDEGAAYVFENNSGTWSQVAKLTATDANDYDYFGYSVAITSDYAVVGAYQDDENETNAGAAYVFENNSGVWSQSQKIMASNPSIAAYFGTSVKISGNNIVVGGSRAENATIQTGTAYIFKNNTVSWTEQKVINASDGVAGDYFGVSVAISGGDLLIGAYRDQDYGAFTGAVYFNEQNYGGTDNWGELTKFIPTSGMKNDNFGSSVSISGNYAIVGAKGDFTNGTGSGASYIYYFDGSEWSEVNKLYASDGAASDNYGISVSISGDYAIVGAPYDDDNGANSGSAYILHNSGGVWSQYAKIKASDGAANDNFGNAVFITGDYIAVSATYDDLKGSVYIFYNSAGTWSQVSKLVSSDGVGSDYFGTSVSMSGNYLVAGAYGDDDNGSSSGSAYIFENNAGSWSQIAKIKASDAAASDYFGRTVSIDGDYIVVGANGNDDNGSASGSAYIFKNDAGTWSQLTKITASDAQASDNFGYSASISGDYAIVGSYLAENTSINSGAAYLYYNNAGTWEEQAIFRSFDDLASEYFAKSVCIDGNSAIFGAENSPLNGSYSGAAYVFAQIMPTVLDDPEDVNDACVGSTVKYNIFGTGLTDFQWQLSSNNGTSWNNISETAPYSGTQSIELSVTVTSAMNDYLFRCIGSNVLGSDTSASAILTTDAQKPVISSTHNDVEIEAGTSSCSASLPDYTSTVVASDNCDASLDITQIPSVGTSVSGTTNTVKLRATDDAGNYSEVSFNVSVVDNTNPSITSVHNNKTVSGNSDCQALLPDYRSDVIASDNCDNDLTITQTPAANSIISGSTNEVTLRVTDDDGNYSEAKFNVSVEDVINPVITSTHNDDTVNANSSCQAYLGDYRSDVIASDNCDASLTISQTPAPNEIISGSLNTVKLRATDDAGNYSEVSFNVVVEDNTNPVISSSHTDKILSAGSSCQALLPDYTTDVIASDNCDNSLTISQTPAANTSVSGTTNTVTIKVTDDAGNYSDVSFNVSVEDNTNPTINSTHTTQYVASDNNCQGTIPDYTTSVSASDNCDNDLTITQTPTAGTVFVTNYKTVTLKVTDDAGNYSEVSFNVVQQDQTSPQITSTHGDKTVSGDANCQAILADYTVDVIASDYCDPSLTITQTPVAGTTITGSVYVTLKVADDAGNYTEASFNVFVEDVIDPQITSVHNNTTVSALNNSCDAILPDYTADVIATDNCDNNLTITQTPEAGTTISTTTNITLKAEDDLGNYDEVSFDVSIVDDTAPVLECVQDQTVNLQQGQNSYVVNGAEFDLTSYTDNCGSVTVENSLNNTSSLNAVTLNVGKTTIWWYATDNSGNIDSCSFDVTVNAFTDIDSKEIDKILIYPNPTSGIFTLENTKGFNVQIIDSKGVLISELNEIKTNEVKLNLSNYANGVYLIKAQNDSMSLTYKLILNK